MAEAAVNMSDREPIQLTTPRREKFVKIAEKRTANAIKAIRIIGKLGNPSAYEYDENDVKKISLN